MHIAGMARTTDGSGVPLAQRILVVNDDARLAESVHQLLCHAGYDARIAQDGEAALRTFSVWPADLILLDLRMPGLDGFGFLRKRAADAALQQAVVLVWSAAGPDELAVARDLGATECLAVASTGPDELLERIARTLAGRQALIR